ncbi:T9SS type B sorting domain-containing protein [Costertonia aggregata]|uniref:T9SS type B sorting domain-containing protein n=1 Tax=Costertonia aggregata TaxID=343403 RepID=A0A7H9APA1_9FLAO|nr:T9SS type B sorting domain-containing protein [Costertonia aggregata]QLG45278.1 T9SS type B sorting domain-containing protein [Costertonia aggregata]
MKPFFSKKTLFLLFAAFCGFALTQAQDIPFTPRLNEGGNTYVNIKGDYTFLSNTVMNRRDNNNTANDPYNGNRSNNNLHIEYIDIDGDNTTFSSTSSTLSVPACSQIYWAGLYWAGNYDRDVVNSRYRGSLPNDNNHYDFRNIKFKVPGGNYIDISADTSADPVGDEDDVIIDGFPNNVPNDPYVCYKNVTSQLQALADPNGEYTVANVRGTRGRTSYGSAGWTLVVIYENPTLPGKYISVFDGYEGITTRSGDRTADVLFSGFNTIPTGPVQARLGVSALEGESRLDGDVFQIQSNSNSNFTDITNAANPDDNFFNSTISRDGVNVTTRNINGRNAIGYDSDVFDLTNPGNSIIDNGDTSATLRLGTDGDWFAAFLVAFGIEIIEPDIVLEKKVEDIAGNDITGAGVNLGQTLDYVLSFKNIGNDDGTNYTIRDILPLNVTLDELNITLPAGVTYVYDEPTRTITFTVPDNLIQEGDPVSSIRMRVRVAENCFDFVNACTDIIQNLAYSTYEGVINDNQISDDPSVTDFDDCGFVTPGATNFLLDDLSACNFTRTVLLCGNDVTLDAGNNFDSYVWYRDENGNNLIDGSDTVLLNGGPGDDTFVVDEIGTYIVDKIVADPCKGFQEIIVVERFGATQTNPISTLINDTSNTVEGEILICPNDGEELPEIFLCGLNDSEPIQINIPDADSIVWQQLDEGSCTASAPECANKNATCTWNNVETGSNFLASNAGQYRLVINYEDGCSSIFYFNIFKNNLDPQADTRDIICTSNGNITVTNMPADYEFQLIDNGTGNPVANYDYATNGTNRSFDIANNGDYTVEMRQQGVTDGCVFRIEDIGIRRRNFTVDITTKDTDCNGLGEISISALDVEPQYYYEISGVSSDTFGPTDDTNYRFTGLSDGTYTVTVTTDDGCTYTEDVTINDVTDLAVSAITTKNIDCTDGQITVTGSGGNPTPDYSYAIWSYNGVDLYSGADVAAQIANIPGSAYQVGTDNVFTFTNGEEGDYEFIIIDGNNCPAFSNSTTIEVSASIEYTMSFTDETCFGLEDGTISFNVTNTNGYSLEYTLLDDLGAEITTNSSGNFTGLAQADYRVRIRQQSGGVECFFFEDFTIGGPVDGVSADAVLIQDYTCTGNGIIEAQNVTGGTAPYSYSIDGITFIPDTTPNANRFENLTNGTYEITVRDATGCPVATNRITLDPLNPPTDLSFSATPPNCPTQTSDVTVTVTDGNAPFVFEITAPSLIAATSITGNTAAFDGLAPNTYSFRVTDDKGCVYNETFTINPVTPIDVTGQLVNNITCFSDTDGAARFTVSGFGTNYDYSVTGPSSFSGTNETNTTIDLTGLDDGTYTITVTDNTTNCTDTASVTVQAPAAALTLSASETQPTCTSTASVALTAANGWGGYTYTLLNPDTSTFGTNTSGNFSGFTQTGTFTARVTDANGCVFDTTFNIDAAVAPVLEIVPNASCYIAANGLTLTANVTSGGDGNFEYSLNGGVFGTTNTFAGLAPGTHRIDVRDGKNCTAFETITINPELTVTASADNITACGTATNVTVTAAGGDGNFVYSIVADGSAPGTFSTTNPVSITGTGDYDVYVRDNAGATGYCEAVFDLNVAQDAPLALNITNTDITCSGSSTSTMTIVASGGEAPYRYSIDNGTTFETSGVFVNQTAGTYNIEVRDTNNCRITQTYTITEPFTLSASAAVTALVECNPTDGAEVRITNAQGGTAPYTYSFDGGSTYVSNPIGFLQPGNHTVYIQDVRNCTFPMNVTVDPQPTAPTLSASVDYECDGEGTVTITPSSTDFNYTYSIDGSPNSPNTSNVFNNVVVGNHTVSVDYISNTPPARSTLLLENFGVGPNTSITEIDPAYCYEPQDGTVSACNLGSPTRINDGEYSVTQVINNPFGSWRNPNDHTGNTGGRFLAINVGGAAGVGGIVYAKRGVEIIPNRDITVSVWAFNLLRVGTGGGDPTIEIQLVDSGGSVIASTATGNIPKNNNADDWQNYTVTLNPGANTNLDIVIRTNSAVTGGNDIAIDDIEAFQTPEQCEGTVTIDVNVEDGRAFGAEITSFTNETCNTADNGTITFSVENFGATGFQYSVNGGAFSTAQTSPSTVTLTGLIADDYDIVVRDASDTTCSITIPTQTIGEPAALSVSNVLTQPTCIADGSVTVAASGGTAGYSYQIEQPNGTVLGPQNGNNAFVGLDQIGLHTITVTDANGCTATDTFTTIAPTSPVASIDAASNLCYSATVAGSASVIIDASAGTAPYMYRMNGGADQATPTFNNVTPGSYTFTVTDANGCTDDVSVTIAQELTASAVLNADLICTVDASATISANGGSGSYSYEWSNTPSPSGTWNATNFAGNVFSTNAHGTYYFRVTDATTPAVCRVIIGPITVTEAVQPVINTVTPTNVTCNGEDTGSLTVDIDTSVGRPPYTIEVIETSGPTNYGTQTTGLPAGDYEVRITDDKGCVSNPFPVTITEPNAVNPNISSTNLTCTASATVLGTITVDASGGTGDYFYRINNNDFSVNQTYDTNGNPNSHTFTGLNFGDYTVSVTDDNNCETISTVTITTGPDVLVTTQGASGCTVGSGEMLVEAQASNGTLGVGTFYFAIYPAPTFNAADPAWFPEDTPSSNSHLFTGLTPGVTYTFVVHDTDTNCEYIQEATVPVSTTSTLSSVIDATSNITCFGSTDGTVEFTISGYGGNNVGYEIFTSDTNVSTGITGSISGAVGGPETDTANSIAPGDFYILFTEIDGPNAGCVIASDEFTIQQAPTLLSVTATSPTNDNCNVNTGIVSATAQFGVAPYEFQYLLASATAPTATSPGWTSSTTASVESGNYRVYVKDANNCIQFDDVTVNLDSSPAISVAVIDECVTEGAFEVLVTLDTAGSTPYLLSVNGGAFQNITFTAGEYTVTGLSSGLGQTIEIRDLNGCGESENIDIHPPLRFNAVLTTLADCETTPGDDNAQITLDAFTGSGSYEYQVFNGATSVQTRTALTLTAGEFVYSAPVSATDETYTITVFDLNRTDALTSNCSFAVDVFVPTAVQPVINTISTTEVSCFGANDGSISISVVDNGVGPYTFQIISGGGSSVGSPITPTSFTATSATFTGLAGAVSPGETYTIRTTGANLCFVDTNQSVVQNPDITGINAIVDPFGCTLGNTPDNATITVSGMAGGSGTFVRYRFFRTDDPLTVAVEPDVEVQNNANNIYTETDFAGGFYGIEVFDDKGCAGSTTARVLPFDVLQSASIAIDDPISCTNAGEDISINAISSITDFGTNPANYEFRQLPSGTFSGTNTFNDLAVGTHNFEVRNVATGCIIPVSHTVVEPNTFTIDVVKLSDVQCFGSETGEITLELLDTTYTGGFNWTIYNTNGTADRADDTVYPGADGTGSIGTTGPTGTLNLTAGSYIVEISQAAFPECTNIEAFSINGPTTGITGDTEVTDITCAPGNNDGVIQVTNVTGGWGDYQYYVSTTPNTDEFNVANYVTNPRFSNLGAGTYEVWVIDVNGCPERLADVVLDNPTPIVAQLQINQENCTNLQGEIEVVGIPATDPVSGGQGSNYTYQLVKDGADFGAPQNTTVFSGLGAGIYEVRISDQWSCVTTPLIGPVELYEEMNLTATIVKPIDCTPDPGGQITITVSGGSSNLEFMVTQPDATTITQSSGIFTGLTQIGTYSFRVRDLDTNNPVCEKTVTERLDDKVDPALLASTIDNVSCFGGNDGSILANLDPATNTNPTYTYELYRTSDLVTPIATQTDPLFENLNADDYRIIVISSRGCEGFRDETITAPTELLINATASPFTCAANNTVNTSTVTVAILDGVTTPGTPSGTSPYLYSIDNVNFQTTNTFEIIDNGMDQTITVYVTDGEGCPATDTVTITALNTFTASVAQNPGGAISCANPEEVTITVTEGGAPGDIYSFELLPVPNTDGAQGATTNTSSIFSLSEVGTYTFRVTNTTTGCYVDTAPYEVAPYDLIDVVATATAPVSCFGTATGAMEINITGYSGNYDYQVFDSANNPIGSVVSTDTSINPRSITGLPGGNLYVRVTETDVPLCTENSNTVTIVSPIEALIATASPQAPTTCTNDQGEILVTPTGGYAPYDIVLTNTTTSQTYTQLDVMSYSFEGLAAGSFTVQITDSGVVPCVFNTTATLAAAVPITADIMATPTTLLCYGDTNATVSATNVTNGEGVYQYQINHYDPTGTIIDFTSGTQTSPIFNNLGAGIYSITVTDGWECGVETVQVTISEPIEVMASLTQVSQLTCTTDAELLLTATGGTAPYTYSEDNVTFAPMSGGNTHRFDVREGSYQYYIEDAFGCKATISNRVSIEAVAPLVIDIDDSAAIVNCTDETTATIIANVTGGLGNYSYELFRDAALTDLAAGPQVADNVFDNLGAGSYYVRVTSVDCIEVSREVVIENPDPLTIVREEFTNVTCNAANDGTISVEVAGGTGEILYAITPTLNRFDAENTFTDLEPGDYEVIAQDERGCFVLFSFTIDEPSPIDAQATTVLPEVCAGSEDGSIELTITGGTAPYRTSLNSNADADFVTDQVLFTDLAAGTYVIFVKDANDCDGNVIVEIEPGVNLNGSAVPVYECMGDTPNNFVNITMDDDSVLGSIMYALDSTDPSDMQLNPDFRNIAPGDHYIAVSHANGCVATMDFNIIGFDPLQLSLEQNNINEITALATGGLEEYTFTFDGRENGNTNTFIINRTDTYTVTVTDQNGCESSAEIFMEFIDIEIPNFFTPDGDGQNDLWIPRNLEAFPEILTIIFDRYGREVYRMGIDDNGWDGFYQETELPTGDYWYIIKLQGAEDDREFVGHFTLYR